MAALAGGGLAAQGASTPPAATAKAAPVFEDGQAQIVDAFRNRKDWIKQFLWVQAEFDSDGDGRKDRLHVDVWRPKQTDTEGLKVPVVYETSPYFAGVVDKTPYWDPKHELGAKPPKRAEAPPFAGRAKPGTFAESEVGDWLPRGFAVVHSSSPGTGFSDGCPTIGGENEALAPKAVIDWLCGRAKGYTAREGGEEVAATWCTGKVGMTGTSYNGTLPVAAATTGVDGLEAIVPIAPNTSYYRYYRSNGLVRHPGGYMGEDMDVLYDFVNSGNPARRAWCNKHVRDELLLANMDRLTGDLSDFWAGRDYANQLGNVKAALLMAHGWNDWNVMPEHSVTIYAAWKQKGLPCIAYFHQSGHGGPPPFELRNRWFTRFLYGVENGVDRDDPKAWIVREGESQPTPYPDYPHPDAGPVTLLPSGDGLAVGALGLERGKEVKPLVVVDDAEVTGARMAMAEKSEHRLLFATEPLAAPLHLSGTAKVTIRLACNKPATNLTVWLVSLPWTERARIYHNLVTRGWADPQNRNSLRKSEPLVPGRFVEVTFDLQPDDQVIPAGKRLGLMIFASDHDFTLWPPKGTKLTIDPAGTSLVLPVVGGAAAFATAAGK
ncbi:MAG: Xaa-Pro dipeptidyl-peptidase [Planctomycetes bacterium]|nr:Xaa-Pro dipeptidyl-peptidase [Planctomycetota bacterium]